MSEPQDPNAPQVPDTEAQTGQPTAMPVVALDPGGAQPTDPNATTGDQTQQDPSTTTPAPGEGDVALPPSEGPATAPDDPGNTGGAPAVPPATPDESGTGAPAESSDAGATGTGEGADLVVPGTPTTPASDLPAAPPMADESGSNIPPPNLVQPIAGDIPTQSVPPESFDPALVDPAQGAADAAEGTTNDATTPPEEGAAKGDVEVATAPDTGGEGEYLYPLTIEDIVVVGHHETVPLRLQGLRARVVDAPRYLIPMSRRDEVWIRVKFDAPTNAELSIPLAAVDQINP